MVYTIHIDDSSSKEAKALIEYLKTLNFIKINEEDIPSWQKDEVRLANQEVNEGKAEYANWKTSKKDLIKKYNQK